MKFLKEERRREKLCASLVNQNPLLDIYARKSPGSGTFPRTTTGKKVRTFCTKCAERGSGNTCTTLRAGRDVSTIDILIVQ